MGSFPQQPEMIQLARSAALVGIATAVAAELAPAFEEKLGFDRVELLPHIERLFELRLGLS